jgi:hypothetical protein
VVSIEGARPVTGAAAGNRRPAGQAASTANRELCRDMRPARQRHHDGDLALIQDHAVGTLTPTDCWPLAIVRG